MKDLLMAVLTIPGKVQTNEQAPSSLAVILQFVENSWPFVITFGAVWKTISEIAKSYSAKQETKLRELIKTTVSPDFAELRTSIDTLVKSNQELSENINKIKYGK